MRFVDAISSQNWTPCNCTESSVIAIMALWYLQDLFVRNSYVIIRSWTKLRSLQAQYMWVQLLIGLLLYRLSSFPYFTSLKFMVTHMQPHCNSKILRSVHKIYVNLCSVCFLKERLFHALLSVHPCIICFKWSQLGAHYFLVYLFQILYMFRATMCTSSGELTVSIRHWYFSLCVGGCLVCWLGWDSFPTSRPDSHPHRVKNTGVA